MASILAGQVEASKKFQAEAGNAIAGLHRAATELQLADTAKQLQTTGNLLKDDTFKIIIAGRFKTGKSTMLNALLGRATRAVPDLGTARGPMPTDLTPCTATLSRINFSERASVRVARFDGSYEEWPFSRYLRESTVKETDTATQQFFAKIREFQLNYPAELCKSGVTVLDSPGLDDVPERTDVTEAAVKECDAAIVVFRTDSFAGQSEREFVQRHILATKTKVFMVVNLWGGTPVTSRFLAVAWDRLVTQLRGGPEYAGQSVEDFARQHDIFFIDARSAEEGRFTGDAALVAASGLDALERRLGDFLLNERTIVHLQKFIQSGETQGQSIEGTIGSRREALRADAKKFQAAAAELQPRFAAIEQKVEKLPRLLKYHRTQCQVDIRNSFLQVANRLRSTLPDELMAYKVPALQHAIILPQHRQKGMEEAAAFCRETIARRVKAWTEGEALRIIRQHAENQVDEVQAEVAAIDRELNRIHFELTGVTVDTSITGDTVSTKEKVGSALLGLVLLDPLAASSGLNGWRGIAANFGARVGTVVLLSVLGMSGGILAVPLVILAGAVAGIVFPNLNLERRMKQSLIDGTKDKPGLNQLLANFTDSTTELLDREVLGAFTKQEQIILDAVTAKVAEETDNIHKMIELNTRSQAEKERELAKLDQIGQWVAAQLKTLKNIATAAQQIVPGQARA